MNKPLKTPQKKNKPVKQEVREKHDKYPGQAPHISKVTHK